MFALKLSGIQMVLKLKKKSRKITTLDFFIMQIKLEFLFKKK